MVHAAIGSARHTPVLLGEVVRFMIGEGRNAGGDVFVDATFGSGGHSKALLGEPPVMRVSVVLLACN